MRKHVSYKRLLALMLIMLFAFGNVRQSASAAYYYYSSYSYTTGSLWWKKTYNVSVYKDSSQYVRYFYGNSSVSTGFEYKGNTSDSIVLSQTRSFSIGKQTVATLNPEISVESLGIKAGIGGSISTTSAASWDVSTTSSRTVGASAPIGYYSYNVCMNLIKLSLVGTHNGNITVYAPASQPYRAILYNKNNAIYSGAVRY